MSKVLAYDQLRNNMVVRVKNFNRNNMPEHWVTPMLDFTNIRYRIRKLFISEERPKQRLHLKHLHSDDMDDLNGFFFCAEDLQKVNNRE